MNTPISAREARKQKKGVVASTSTPTLAGPADTPEVEVTGVRLISEIPVILVPSDEVPETAEDAPTGVQESGVPEAGEDQVPGIEDDSPEGAREFGSPRGLRSRARPKRGRCRRTESLRGVLSEKGRRRRGRSRLPNSSAGMGKSPPPRFLRPW